KRLCMKDTRKFFSIHDDEDHRAVRAELVRWARDPEHLVLNKDSPAWGELLEKMMTMPAFAALRAFWLDRHSSKLGQEVHRQAKFYLSECLQKAGRNKNVTRRLIQTVYSPPKVGEPSFPAPSATASAFVDDDGPAPATKTVNMIIIDPDAAQKTVG